MSEVQTYPPHRGYTVNTFLFALFILIISIGLVGGTVYLFKTYENSLPTSTITVTGTSEQKVMFDKATTTLYITQRGTDVNQLNGLVDKATIEVLNYLESQGVANDDIQSNKNSYPDYSMPEPLVPQLTAESNQTQASPKSDRAAVTISTPPSNPATSMPVRTQARNMIVEASIKVVFDDISSDPSEPNQILNEVTRLGVTRYDNLMYEIQNKDTICEDLKNEAISDAIKKGRDTASALGGKKIIRYEVNQIQGCDNGYLWPMLARSSEAVVDSTSVPTVPPIQPGQETVKGSVNLTLMFR